MSPSSGTPDWDVPLSKLAQGKGGHELLKEALSFIYHEEGSPGSYLSKLRFLAPLQTRSHPVAHIDNILDPFSDCVCSGYMPFTAADYLSETPSLVLTDPGALAGCKHYVAISYCWQQSEQHPSYDPGVSIPHGYNIHTNDGVRANRAPASVIHRSLIYAAAHGYRFLWIDQESINQDDLIEKAEAVQQMNHIYRQAEQTVAIFSNTIMDQIHLDKIERLGVEKGMHRISVQCSR
ncbi:hypothetical protein ACEPPN_019311 [Leptodophora sp. 'Broadleaf-Isolate-01']